MELPDREQIEQLPARAVFRWLFRAALAVCLSFQLLMGLLAAFGLHTVWWGGRPVTGFWALLVAPVIGLFAALVLTICLGLAFLAARRVFSAAEEAAIEEETLTQDLPPSSEVNRDSSHNRKLP